MTAPVSNIVIDRIRKLMALTAERGATEAEATLASEHVQRLLSEHNLSMAIVEMDGGDTGTGGKRTREGVSHRQVYKWQRELMVQLAELNFCKPLIRFQSRGWGKPDVFNGYDLIGRADNVTTTKVMFEYLLQTIERLAREEVKDSSQFFTRYAHSFKEGCSDRIIARLQEQQRRIVEEQERRVREEKARSSHPAAATYNALVVTITNVAQNENDLNNDVFNGWKSGTTAARRAKYEAERAQREEEGERLRAERRAAALTDDPNTPADVLRYMEMGFSRERAEEICKPAKPETEAQRRKREEREKRAYWRDRERTQRADKRLDGVGYRRGYDAGKDVSLNRQVDGNEWNRLK